MTDRLKEVALDNLQFFSKLPSESNFSKIFEDLLEIVDKIIAVKSEVETFSSDYDLDEKTIGNGYRSLICIFDKAAVEALNICDAVRKDRENVFFRRKFYEKYDKHILIINS